MKKNKTLPKKTITPTPRQRMFDIPVLAVGGIIIGVLVLVGVLLCRLEPKPVPVVSNESYTHIRYATYTNILYDIRNMTITNYVTITNHVECATTNYPTKITTNYCAYERYSSIPYTNHPVDNNVYSNNMITVEYTNYPVAITYAFPTLVNGEVAFYTCYRVALPELTNGWCDTSWIEYNNAVWTASP